MFRPQRLDHGLVEKRAVWGALVALRTSELEQAGCVFAALETGCELFLTHDQVLKRFTELTIEVLT
jgi:hypothetical protein